MAWRPSKDPRFTRLQSTPYWEALQTIFDEAFPVTPIPRRSCDEKFLPSEYLIERQGREHYDRGALLSTIPRVFRKCDIGPTEINCLDFLFNSKKDRILSLVGPRGAGKTSLVNYLEYLLNQNRTAKTPFLLIMDGNRLDSGHEHRKSPGISDFTHQLCEEIESLAKFATKNSLPSGIQTAVIAGAAVLRAPYGRDQLIHALKNIVELLPNNDASLLVFVFDNLDHLAPKSIDAIFQLARDLQLSCRTGSIICLRRQSFRMVGDRGGARNFVNTYEQVSPPTLAAWLRAFPQRMRTALNDVQKQKGYREAHGKRITLIGVEMSAIRFAQLLENRQLQDDPTEFIHSVAAQNVRHLIALVRRMLENRHLPSEWLLLKDSQLTPNEVMRSYHPMRAAMEGAAVCYKDNDFIRNVLCFDTGFGSPDFLIQYRLLNLLSGDRVKPIESLLRWTKEYGYDEVPVFEALDSLKSGGLVTGSDLDLKWSNTNRPDSCRLTDSGDYFLNHLLVNADYLTSAVMDVSLEHKALAASPRGEGHFSHRISSLFEYLKEVKERENSQIASMKRRVPTPELKVAADRLRNGGTLTSKILRGVKAAVGRIRNSEISRIRASFLDFEQQIAEYDTALTSMENALTEVRRKAIKHDWPDKFTSFVLNDPASGTNINIDFRPQGDNVEAKVILNSSVAHAGVIASICDPITNQQLATANLRAKSSSLSRLTGEFEWSRTESPATSLRVQTISLPEHGGSIATISTNRDRNGGATLEMCIWRKGDPDAIIIGYIADCQKLCDWAKARLQEVDDCLLHEQPIERKIRGIGLALAEQVLTPVGRERILQVALEVDTCLVTSDMRIVPWEWMIPDDGADCLSIGDLWDTVRWHPSANGRNFARMENRPPEAIKRRFLTVGLPHASDAPWCLGLPIDFDELVSWLHQPGSKHLVAHYEKGRYQIGANQLWISDIDIIGSIPHRNSGPNEIVLSSCGAGAQDDPNLAVIFSERWGCRTWAPLTNLQAAHVLRIDQHLAERMEVSKKTMSAELSESRKIIPHLRLYVQYGVKFYSNK